MAIATHRRTLGSCPNEGARKTWLILEERGWGQAELRAEILKQTGRQITSGALVKYLYCERRPGVLWSEAFETVLGVTPIDWHRLPEREFLPPAAREDLGAA
jgi:hypothetical protein